MDLLLSLHEWHSLFVARGTTCVCTHAFYMHMIAMRSLSLSLFWLSVHSAHVSAHVCFDSSLAVARCAAHDCDVSAVLGRSRLYGMQVGGTEAALFDYARGGPQWGADALVIGPPRVSLYVCCACLL